jgi:hypothetical protein
MLADAGLSSEAVQRAALFSFGSAEAAFEAIAPQELVVDGKAVGWSNLGPGQV